MSGLWVLVVDDDPDCAAVVSEALVIEGHGVVVAATAPEALRAVQRRRPGLVIVDGHLGGNSAGIDLVRQLRRGPFGNGPVLLATGMSRAEIEEEARNAGVDEVLVKPIELSVLLATVTRLTAGRETG